MEQRSVNPYPPHQAEPPAVCLSTGRSVALPCHHRYDLPNRKRSEPRQCHRHDEHPSPPIPAVRQRQKQHVLKKRVFAVSAVTWSPARVRRPDPNDFPQWGKRMSGGSHDAGHIDRARQRECGGSTPFRGQNWYGRRRFRRRGSGRGAHSKPVRGERRPVWRQPLGGTRSRCSLPM